jgi:hypothetical protein
MERITQLYSNYLKNNVFQNTFYIYLTRSAHACIESNSESMVFQVKLVNSLVHLPNNTQEVRINVHKMASKPKPWLDFNAIQGNSGGRV